MAAAKCVICGKTADNFAVNPTYPQKPICLNCLNGFILNLKTLEEELEPLIKELEKALESIDKKV